MDGIEFEAKARGEACIARVERNAEEARARNAGNSVGAVGETLPVDDHETDDLAEGERHDRKIITTQPQYRKAEEDSPKGGEDSRHRQADPERPAEGLREQRI